MAVRSSLSSRCYLRFREDSTVPPLRAVFSFVLVRQVGADPTMPLRADDLESPAFADSLY